MKQFSNKKYLTGFTLIEILVVMAIIGILAATIFPNYQSARQQLALQRAANKLAQDIRRAQEMTMSSQEYNDCSTGSTFAYGMRFVQSQDYYNLFADCNNNGNYDGQDKIIGGDIKLEKNILINSIIPFSATGLRIVFTPPDPVVNITPSSSTATIGLINSGGKTKNIILNKAGLIYAVD